MKKILEKSAYLLLFPSVFLVGCKREECLCERVEVEEHRQINKGDSIYLDSIHMDLFGPEPNSSMDSSIRYTRENSWNHTRLTIVLTKDGSAYSLQKTLFKLDQTFSDSLVHSETRPLSQSKWKSVVVAVNRSCFFMQPSIYKDSYVLDASPLSMEVHFPERNCGAENFRLSRIYIREDDPLSEVLKALKEAGVFLPYSLEHTPTLD